MIERGAGCRVWDLDGDEYVEFGGGLRSVTLGHGFEPVMDAGSPTVSRGATFILPSPISLCGHGRARCRGSHVFPASATTPGEPRWAPAPGPNETGAGAR